jgi:hypothetical protein
MRDVGGRMEQLAGETCAQCQFVYKIPCVPVPGIERDPLP